jgi:hypothetical protein
MQMKIWDAKWLRKAVLSACLLIAISLATGFAQDLTQSDDKTKCKDIKASGTTALVSTGCTSPVGVCASGAFSGDNLIRGTTFASLLGIAASIGLPGIEPPSTLSLSGERTIITPDGTLLFRFVTVFDTARGEAAEVDRVTGGTGKFEGATGTMFITGTGTTSFAIQATGNICLAKP